MYSTSRLHPHALLPAFYGRGPQLLRVKLHDGWRRSALRWILPCVTFPRKTAAAMQVAGSGCRSLVVSAATSLSPPALYSVGPRASILMWLTVGVELAGPIQPVRPVRFQPKYTTLCSTWRSREHVEGSRLLMRSQLSERTMDPPFNFESYTSCVESIDGHPPPLSTTHQTAAQPPLTRQGICRRLRRGWGDTCPTRVAPPTIITCRPVSEAGLPCNGIVAVAACLVKPQSGHRGAMRHRVEPTTAGKASLMLYRTAPGTGRGPAETGVSFRPRSGLARWLSQMESVAALYRMCLKIDDVACRGV